MPAADCIFPAAMCGYSLVVKLQLPKLIRRVRFPLSAPCKPRQRRLRFGAFLCSDFGDYVRSDISFSHQTIYDSLKTVKFIDSFSLLEMRIFLCLNLR